MGGDTLTYNLSCGFCGQNFLRERKQKYKKRLNVFCSPECSRQHHDKRINKPCTNCGKLMRRGRDDKRNKTGNGFCSQSCAATYNNTHKTKGNRRSRAEIFIEENIRVVFPKITVLCNEKEVIGSELDFYFPDLQLAIELNGIFHYEPIYGEDKLNQIQTNDKRKFLACQQKGISLAIVDMSSCKYFNAAAKNKYLSIILDIINGHIKEMAPSEGIEPTHLSVLD